MALLRDWLTQTGMTVAEVAARLDVAPSTVYRWRDGIKVPRPEQVGALERLSAGAVTANDHQQAYAEAHDSLMGTSTPHHGPATSQSIEVPA